jgi:hypothetical protein
VTTDVTTTRRASRELEGLLPLNYRGPAMKVQIKDIVLKELPDGDLLTPKGCRCGRARRRSSGRRRRKKGKWKRAGRLGRQEAGTGRAAAIQATQFIALQAAGSKKRPLAATGLAIGENKRRRSIGSRPPRLSRRAAVFHLAAEQGSWVNLCVDDKGRIIASDQYEGCLPRAAARAAVDSKNRSSRRHPGGQRMLWAFGALYVAVNDYEKKSTAASPPDRFRW